MLKGFKEFVLRGNLVELAVAFIMATAFAVLVTETVNLLMSVLAKLSGNKEPDFSAWQPGGVPVGSWINARASATRWRWPRESAPTLRSPNSCTATRSQATCHARSGAVPRSRATSSMFSRAVSSR